MDYVFHYDSPLGGITMGSDGEALVGLWFDGQRYFGNTLHPQFMTVDLPVFRETRRWLDLYFRGQDPGFTPKLAMRASPFRKEVWEALIAIPFGETVTYGEIAARIAAGRRIARMSSQAVGGAVGHNAISLIIPCHRVVGTDGSLTGYAAGLDRKLRLLQLENAQGFASGNPRAAHVPF